MQLDPFRDRLCVSGIRWSITEGAESEYEGSWKGEAVRIGGYGRLVLTLGVIMWCDHEHYCDQNAHNGCA